jgi:hypothetical protein
VEEADLTKDNKPNDTPKVGRRDFLRALGAGGGASAVAASIPTEAIADNESSDEKRKARYRETEHVKTFYRVNRYPAKR